MKNWGHYFEMQAIKMKRRFFGLDNLSDTERSHFWLLTSLLFFLMDSDPNSTSKSNHSITSAVTVVPLEQNNEDLSMTEAESNNLEQFLEDEDPRFIEYQMKEPPKIVQALKRFVRKLKSYFSFKYLEKLFGNAVLSTATFFSVGISLAIFILTCSQFGSRSETAQSKVYVFGSGEPFCNAIDYSPVRFNVTIKIQKYAHRLFWNESFKKSLEMMNHIFIVLGRLEINCWGFFLDFWASFRLDCLFMV